MNEQRKTTIAVSAAVLAGVVAAGVAYLLYVRPQWRRQVVEVSRHLLNVADGILPRRAVTADTPAEDAD